MVDLLPTSRCEGGGGGEEGRGPAVRKRGRGKACRIRRGEYPGAPSNLPSPPSLRHMMAYIMNLLQPQRDMLFLAVPKAYEPGGAVVRKGGVGAVQ